MHRNVAGILLAAGDGSRLGQPKAPVVIGGQSLARRGIGLLRAGGASPVIVVSGAARWTRAGRAGVGCGWPETGVSDRERPAVISVHNPRWQTGMGSSLAVGPRGGAGLTAPRPCSRWRTSRSSGPEAVRRLIAAHASGRQRRRGVLRGAGRAIPVLIGREHWAEVAALAVGDVGARPFLRAHPDLVTQIECGDTGAPDDIDTPEDLARVAALLGSAAPFRS